MKFSELKPFIGSAHDLCTPARPAWRVSFECPICRHITSVAVSTEPAANHVWNIQPNPIVMMNSLQVGEDFTTQWNRLWDGVTIMPSMQNLPHPRQVNCTAHITVTAGEVTFH